MESRPGAADESSRSAWGWWALAALPWAWLVSRFWFVTDDAYISFRYARNWAEGHGLRYNLGEHPPVEGFSNFLWVALTALVERVGLDPVAVVPALSALAGLGLLAAVHACLRRDLGASRRAATLAVLALGCTTPFAVWTTGGLETMSFALLLFLCVREWSFGSGPRSSLVGGLFALGVVLSRPEGLAWVLVALVATSLSRRARGERGGLLPGATLALLGAVLFLAWREHAFGHALPTSATAKLSAGWGLDRLARGWNYVALQLVSTPSLLLFLGAAVAGLTRARTAPFALFALGFPVWSVLVSGDFMAFGRFLVPGLAFAAVAGGALLDRVERRGARGPALAAVLALATAALGALPAWNLYLVPRSVRERLDVRPHLEGFRSEYGYWHMQLVETKRWARRGRVLAQISGPGDSIVLSAIGAVGYYSRLFVHDRLGLVTREVAELEPVGDARERTPGHDNPVPAQWFLDRGLRPTFIRANFQGVSERSELVEKVERSKRNLDANGLTDEYAIDLRQVVRPGGSGRDAGLEYFMTWRRIPEGVPPRVAWESFDRGLEAHLGGADLPQVVLGADER